jgi:hypothetical protein
MAMTGWPSGEGEKAARRGQFIEDIAGELAVKCEDVSCLLEGIEHHATQHQGADRMELVLEGGDDAKVPAASHAPEESRVLGGTGGQEPAVGRDDIDGEEVIGDQAVLASQPADPTTKDITESNTSARSYPRWAASPVIGSALSYAHRVTKSISDRYRVGVQVHSCLGRASQ